MIYLEIIEDDKTDYIFFDDVTAKDEWLTFKQLERLLDELEPVVVVSEGNLSQWIRQRLPNVAVYRQVVQKKQLIHELERDRQKMLDNLTSIEQKLKEAVAKVISNDIYMSVSEFAELKTIIQL